MLTKIWKMIKAYLQIAKAVWRDADMAIKVAEKVAEATKPVKEEEYDEYW